VPAYHNAFACEVGKDLVPEKVGVNPLSDAGPPGLFFRDFPDPAGSELRGPVRFEQVDSALVFLDARVLGQLATEIRRESSPRDTSVSVLYLNFGVY